MEISVEFPRVPDSLVGQKHRYGYMAHMSSEFPAGIGVVKYDFETDHVTECTLPSGQYCGEPVFVPRENGSSEDDGYLVTFLIDENSGTSELAILDASDVTKGPICRMALPHKISSGVHSTWVERDRL